MRRFRLLALTIHKAKYLDRFGDILVFFSDVFKTGKVFDVAHDKTVTINDNRVDSRVVQGTRRRDNGHYCLHWSSESPWLEIDLKKAYIILDIFISVYRYQSKSIYNHLERFDIIVSNKTGDTNGTRCAANNTLYFQSHDRIYCQNKPQGRYLRIVTPTGEQYFGICSVEVTGK